MRSPWKTSTDRSGSSDTVGLSGDDDRLAVALAPPNDRCPADLAQVLLLGKQVDHGIRRVGVELARIRVLQAALVTGELDDGTLEAEADPEERDPELPGESDGVDLALPPAVAESSRNEDPV